MNTVFGSVIVSETGHGISNLLVAAFNVSPTTGPTTPPQDAWLRLASTITDAEGKFRIEYETSNAEGDAGRRVQLLLCLFQRIRR
jgi:hypothetical protein